MIRLDVFPVSRSSGSQASSKLCASGLNQSKGLTRRTSGSEGCVGSVKIRIQFFTFISLRIQNFIHKMRHTFNLKPKPVLVSALCIWKKALNLLEYQGACQVGSWTFVPYLCNVTCVWWSVFNSPCVIWTCIGRYTKITENISSFRLINLIMIRKPTNINCTRIWLHCSSDYHRDGYVACLCQEGSNAHSSVVVYDGSRDILSAERAGYGDCWI